MKRIIAIVAVGLIAAGAVFAQARGTGPGAFGPGAQVQNSEPVKVEGKLALVNGHIALQAKDKTYYVMGIQPLVGFVDGLKEGATVKLEGDAFEMPMAPEYLVLRATKLTVNGKDYDLSRGFGMAGRGMMGGRRGGACFDDDFRGRRGGRF